MAKPGTSAGSAPGFFATVFRLCAGTKIIPEIYKTSPGRAIWRFFLLTVLCAILASVVVTTVQSGTFRRAGRGLDEEIGAIVFSQDGISLQKDPDVPRSLQVLGGTLEYYPGDTFDRKDFDIDRTTDSGFIILPGGLAQWAWGGGWKSGEYTAVFLPANVIYNTLSTHGTTSQLSTLMNSVSWGTFSGPQFAETLRKEFCPSAGKPENAGAAAEANADKPENAGAAAEANADKPGNAGAVAEANADKPGNAGAVAEANAAEPAAERKAEDGTAAPRILLTGSTIASSALFALTVTTLVETFFFNFLQIGLIILLVSLIQYLRASTLPKGIAYRNVLTIMVYSTFPAQIVATLFDAAGADRVLSIFSFQIVFIGVFFVYQIFAFRAVMQKVCPPPPRRDDDFDDPDF